MSRYSTANPLAPIDRRSPPLPFTAITRDGLPGQRIRQLELRARVAAAEVGDAEIFAEEIRAIAQQLERRRQRRRLRDRPRGSSERWSQWSRSTSIRSENRRANRDPCRAACFAMQNAHPPILVAARGTTGYRRGHDGASALRVRHLQVVRGRPRAARRLVRPARGRGACAGRRERRRQVDAHQDHDRRGTARRGDARRRRASRSAHDAGARARAGDRGDLSAAVALSAPHRRREYRAGARERAASGAASTGRRGGAGRARCSSEVGAAIDPERLVGTLSMPEQQIVEIAKAIGADAKILIMDEPTASLTDERGRRACSASSRMLRAQGVGIIYISHRLEEVFAVSDRVTVLRDGETVATRETDAIDRRGAHPADGGPRADGRLSEAARRAGRRGDRAAAPVEPRAGHP